MPMQPLAESLILGHMVSSLAHIQTCIITITIELAATQALPWADFVTKNHGTYQSHLACILTIFHAQNKASKQHKQANQP